MQKIITDFRTDSVNRYNINVAWKLTKLVIKTGQSSLEIYWQKHNSFQIFHSNPSFALEGVYSINDLKKDTTYRICLAINENIKNSKIEDKFIAKNIDFNLSERVCLDETTSDSDFVAIISISAGIILALILFIAFLIYSKLSNQNWFWCSIINDQFACFKYVKGQAIVNNTFPNSPSSSLPNQSFTSNTGSNPIIYEFSCNSHVLHQIHPNNNQDFILTEQSNGPSMKDQINQENPLTGKFSG